MAEYELNTFPAAIWVLQSLLGIETLPWPLRLAPYSAVGSAHIPVEQYPEYQRLVSEGVIDASGKVDDPVDEWLTVLSRTDLQVQLTIRTPGDDPETVKEAVTIFGRHQRWIAAIERTTGDADEVAAQIGFEGDPADLPAAWVDRIRVYPVGDLFDVNDQAAAITSAIMGEIKENLPAEIEGVTLKLNDFFSVSGDSGKDPELFAKLLARQGLSIPQIEVLTEVMNLDQSALAVVSATHVWPDVEPIDQQVMRTVSIADTRLGRIVMSQSQDESGIWWLRVWPGTVATVRRDISELVSIVTHTPVPTL